MGRMGFDFGDLHLEIPINGFTVDVDIENKRDIFTFGIPESSEYIVLSTTWDSHPHRLLKVATRQLENS